MKRLLCTLLLSVVLAGCASVNVTRETSDGSSTTVTYRTLWRNLQDVNASYGEFNLELGNASSSVSPEAVACIIAPSLCQLQP